ncbi:Multidrug resistance protein ABC Superfamily, partial [Phytophthora palmivora]
MEEKITTRLRTDNFRGLCRQNVGFFDEKENATGALTADLATNATKVSLLSGESQSAFFQAVFTLVAALVISFGFGSWLLSLIMLALIPMLLFGEAARMKEMEGAGLISDDLAVPGAHASEVLGNIRTVASLGIEKRSADVFDVLLLEPLRKGRKEAQINGLSLGFSSFILMATNALIFWFGAKKVDDGTIGFGDMMRTLMAITMSMQTVSMATKFLSDAPKAFKAGSTIFAIRDRIAPIDSFSPDGEDISFRYPTRPEINVLKHYKLTIEPGQTVAFCGPSGGGKSTIISLIERFYDPVVGDVLLDGYNIKDLNLGWLRSQIGLVGQEPTLFIGTIAENIAYGLAEQPSQQEIEEAAKMANAHDFITQFPEGYDTQVGMKGEQLSGGQKQRIAIARAILKNPNILLLDEATSALDSESEKVVQEALDKVVALKRRTTIVIAHRLSTIRRADKICVVSGGKIAEQGTHQELLQLNGIYAAQVTMSPRPKSPHETPYTALLTPRGSFNKAKTSKFHPHNDDHGLPFLSLYRFATAADKLQLVLGAIMAGLNGAIFPCMALVFGTAIDAFAQADGGVDRDAVNRAALYYFLIAIALFITDCLAYILFCNSAEKQMKALRAQVFTHMLYMDVSWYDRSDAFELTSRITGDTVKIKDGMGQKLGDSIKFTCQFFVGYIIGFARGWDMSLVMACVMPIMVLSLKYMVRLFRKRAVLSQKMYAEAGAVAEETLGSIRTVASLNGEKRAIEKYNERAILVETGNIAISKRSACVFGCMMGSIWLMYAAGLWYGGSKVAKAEASPGTVFQAFFGVLMGTISLSQISPNITAVAEAKGAAAEIYKILDTQSAINASKEDEGDRPNSCVGRIQALGVNFTYPSRPDVQILNDYNVTIEPGQTVAFVGASGGGKSTLISLLERFYDPQEGTILLDGRDVKTLNVKWLRSQIGLVSQEPVLFATTIFENIAAGGNGITRDEVVAAAKLANAHTFIMSLPEQYDTLVGEKGVSLSGGQKQRVAIARAIVREPKILVLDEATSALDNESERVVQAALNNLMDKTHMTTLVIAHRLSTIRRADKIVVVNAGHVVEEGSHDELVAIEHGIYQNLYRIQEEKNQEEAEAAANALLQAGNDGAVKMPRKLSSRSIGSELLPGSAAPKEIQDSVTEGKFTIVDALEFSRPERKFFVTGLIAASINGFSMPCSAILISEMVASMTTAYTNYQTYGLQSYLDHLSSDITIYGVSYIAGAVVLFVTNATQNFCFRYMAEKLTSRLRGIHFSALCRQNIAFFDEKKNATGALAADLSTNATKVAMISGDSQGRVVQAAFTFIAALVISFTTGSWLLTLVMLAVFPLLIIGQVIRMRHVRQGIVLTDELADVGAHASEALSNIRTVVSMGLEKSMAGKFNDLLEEPLASGRREARLNGVALGFSSFIVFATYALVFWYGGKLVDGGDITFAKLIRTLMAIMMSAQGVGSAASFLGDSDNAVKAGKAIVAIKNLEPPIDSFDESGLQPAHLEGKIEFKNVAFRYPTRPEVTVLKNYNLTIEAGQTVAFCGPSGGGKST